MIHSVLCQAHLSPLSTSHQPIAFSLDHALRLNPLPDVLVVAEDADPWIADAAGDGGSAGSGCRVFNPGSFAADGSFAFYAPATRSVDASVVPPAEDDGASASASGSAEEG
jgi:DNA polymerase epsilon subunit 2